MRISDWSSDVCSSDLQPDRDGARHFAPRLWHAFFKGLFPLPPAVDRHHHRRRRADAAVVQHAGADRRHRTVRYPVSARTISRSEEHTSELQSLMRISYAVFCLKKKKKNKHTTTHNTRMKRKETRNNKLTA